MAKWGGEYPGRTREEILQAAHKRFFELKAAEVKAAEVRDLPVRAPRLSACPALGALCSV